MSSIKYLLPIGALILGIVAYAGNRPHSVDSAGQENNLQFFSEAASLAEESNKPIMLVFTGKNTDGRFWCPPCVALDRSIFQTDQFQKWAPDNVVQLEIILPRDAWASEEIRDHNLQLQEKYEIQSVPTVVFTDAQGNLLGKNPTRQGPEQWIDEASKMIAAQ